TLDYVLRDMTAPEGGFYSTEDADSEGEEGKFYVWTLDELETLLSPQEATVAARYWGVSEEGNFEGHTILNIHNPAAELVHELGLSVEQIEARVASARAKLLAARSQRIRPARDEKILTGWNGLMLRALAEAGRALDRPDYIAAAQRNADFALAH